MTVTREAIEFQNTTWQAEAHQMRGPELKYAAPEEYSDSSIPRIRAFRYIQARLVERQLVSLPERREGTGSNFNAASRFWTQARRVTGWRANGRVTSCVGRRFDRSFYRHHSRRRVLSAPSADRRRI